MPNLLKLFILLIISFQFLLGAIAPNYVVIPNQTSLPILTPSIAERETLKIRLENGLEVFLVSDLEAKQGGAVLTVQAGSWDDPTEHPGLAHFLEHMLFLGTEKYPIESDYDRFIHENDGDMNAYTGTDHSLYLFSINPPAFQEALDRFSSFFKTPLFNPSGIEREMHAIDQEFSKNFFQNASRENQVSKALANPKHPFHLFSTGNSKTLSSITQDDFKQWFHEHYTADKMRLTVYAPFSIKVLKNWVIDNFKDIPSTSHSTTQATPAIFDNLRGKMVHIDPLQNNRTLRLTWELPASYISSSSFKPAEFISSILGNEGQGSLISILREKGLAYDISFTNDRLSKDRLLFSLNLHLTNKGLNKVWDVIAESFSVIETIKNLDLPPYLFDEMKKIQTLRYQFQSREDIFNHLMTLGSTLVYEDTLSSFPESAFVSEKFDPIFVKEFLNQLTPQQAFYTVIAPHSNPNFFDHTEEWMKVPYKVSQIPVQQLNQWSHLLVNSKFHLPEPNPFIPENLTLTHSKQLQSKNKNQFPTPIPLHNTSTSNIYFAENTFGIPLSHLIFEIKTPAIDVNDPEKVIYADLYIRSLEEALADFRYPAQNADLSFQFTRTNNGILISIYGYCDNTELLFNTILERLKNCYPTRDLFLDTKNYLQSKYGNPLQGTPLQQGIQTYQKVLYHSRSTPEQRAEAVSKIDYNSFIKYMDHLYDYSYVEGILSGNLTQAKAKEIANKLETSLHSLPYPKEEWASTPPPTLPVQGPYKVELPSPSSAHVAILAIKENSPSFKARAAQEILSQAMSTAFYTSLRTKQQTGYLVSSRIEELDNTLFTLFSVQSSTHEPRDLLSRFDQFIEDYLNQVGKNELTEEHFERLRRTMLAHLEINPDNLRDQTLLMKELAFKHEGDFDWTKKRIEGIKDLSYQEFLDTIHQFLGEQNNEKLAILIKGSKQENNKEVLAYSS